MELEPYLLFNGDCEDALNFYATIFGGGITSMMRFSDAPMAEQMPPEARTKIMHANFKAPELKFMASDGRPGAPRPEGTRVTLSLGTKDLAAATRVFEKLAQGGTISMPFEKQFWGDTFGMLTDRYGIDWMVNSFS